MSSTKLSNAQFEALLIARKGPLIYRTYCGWTSDTNKGAPTASVQKLNKLGFLAWAPNMHSARGQYSLSNDGHAEIERQFAKMKERNAS